MDDTTTIQSLRRRKSQPNSPICKSNSLPLEDFRRHNARPSSPASTSQQRRPDQVECDDETSLLNEAGSLDDTAAHISSPTRLKALGLFGICVLVLGTVGIVLGMAFLTYLWRSSMRAQAGQIDNGELWFLFVAANWISVTVTLTAAIIRVCMGFQMGILTGMTASLLVERTGVPLSSAPLISMLRALSTSPYNLVSRKTLVTPFGVAICLAVLLTAASNFTSTILLVDFQNINIKTPNRSQELLYGNSRPEDSLGSEDSLGFLGGARVGTLRGSKIWNSQPNSYFRFAELGYDGVRDTKGHDAESVDDSGTAIRAILPFSNASDRTTLRGYDGPSVVFDSRVVCTRPNLDLEDISFSTVMSTNNRRGNGRPYQFDEVFVTGSFKIPNNPSLFHADYNPPLGAGWYFTCVFPAPKDAEKTPYWSISFCEATGGVQALDSQSTRLPKLKPTKLPRSPSGTSTFLIFNTTGSIDEWRKYIKEDGKEREGTYRMSKSAKKWSLSEDEIWVRLRPPPGSFDATVSISTCLTNLPGAYLNVRMSSENDGLEPRISRDRLNKDQYDTTSIREQYANHKQNGISQGSPSILALHPKTGWDFENDQDMERLSSGPTLDHWMLFNSVTDGLPYMNLNGVTETFEILAGGILLPGALSPYTVHYAHAALFQDITRTTGSLAQGLQGLFTVLRQMAYYENSPYFDINSTAVLTFSSEKLIPTQWNGFILVASMVLAHFLLLAVITALFLGWTRASWLGNVWASLSQVVSYDTKDLIETSTDKDDEAVAKTILKVSSAADGKSTFRVRVKGNGSNGRNELSLM